MTLNRRSPANFLIILETSFSEPSPSVERLSLRFVSLRRNISPTKLKSLILSKTMKLQWMQLGCLGNHFLQRKAPWTFSPEHKQYQDICALACTTVTLLGTMLMPFLPTIETRLSNMFNFLPTLSPEDGWIREWKLTGELHPLFVKLSPHLFRDLKKQYQPPVSS